MTDQPIPHTRCREFTSEATAIAKLLSGDMIGDPSAAVVRIIADGLCAAYNTGRADEAAARGGKDEYAQWLRGLAEKSSTP